MQAECFQIHAADNVATLLQDAEAAAEVLVLGGESRKTLRASEPILASHKIALRSIGEGESIVKYGFQIGEATHPIAAGDWVHLHNCRSLCDARSSELDVNSGSRVETRYA